MIVKLNILITGATGFVGNALLQRLVGFEKYKVEIAQRSPEGSGLCFVHSVGDFDSDTDWSSALTNQHLVIHAAARTHVMKDKVAEPLIEYRRVNVAGTLNLACQAAAAGVQRFIYISSIKVNGEHTLPGEPFTSDDMPSPSDDYGISKWEAEQGLRRIAAKTGMELVIIRPPLVYGPGVKGNFVNIIRLVSLGLPLPLGAIHNQRSLVALENLVDLIATCVDHPAAANQVFLAGDGMDVSTTELLRGIAKAMAKPAFLVPVPVSVLMFAATLSGNKEVARRLFGSLQVDISKARNLLDWTPPLTVEEGLRRCFNDHSES